jgi:CTP:molybdopterin cytidylyltransferase MocA
VTADAGRPLPGLPPFAGLVLAGGAGRRWGGPKAWARLPDGTTFLDAALRTLTEAGAATVVATLPPGSSERHDPGARTVALPRPGLDMFSSLVAGLEVLEPVAGWEAVVVLPVDHPLVGAATVRALVAAGPPAAIPTLGGRHGHPICMWRPVARAVVDGSRPGPTLREVLRAAGAHDVPVPDPGVRANCNSPEALRAALDARRS